MPTLLRRIEKSEIDEAEGEAFHHRVDCACCLAQSYRLIASFEGNARDGFWRKRARAAASSTIHGSEKLYIFGNKARTGRVSCLAAQFSAIWCAVWPTGRVRHGQKRPRRSWTRIGSSSGGPVISQPCRNHRNAFGSNCRRVAGLRRGGGAGGAERGHDRQFHVRAEGIDGPGG